MHKKILFIDDSWPTFEKLVLQNLKHGGKVLEIGAGSNPFLSKEIVENFNLVYHIQDIDEEELNKAKGQYFFKLPHEISKIEGQYDLIFSQMVLEHIEDPSSFHLTLKNILSPQGTIIHFFATLYNIASVANALLPEKVSRFLLLKFANRNLYQHDKFPAYYKKCLGPTKGNITFFEKSGFVINDYYGFAGHNYFWKYKLLFSIEKKWSRLLVQIQNPYLCSNAIVVLSKT